MAQPITTAHAIRTDDNAAATKAAATWDADDAVYDDGKPWEDDPAEDPRAIKAKTSAPPDVVTGHALRR